MKNKNQIHYRQGDVLVERVGLLPQKLTPVARENGRVILAHGEVTGHAHAIADRATEKFKTESGEEFLRVVGQKIKMRLHIERRWRSQVLVRHPKLGLIQFAEADVEIEGTEAVINGDFGLLTHDEHHTHALPAGYYRNVRQSEYNPEEIRRVAD